MASAYSAMKLFKLLFALKAFSQTKIGKQRHTDYTIANVNKKKIQL